jgi:hypothetical protein
VCASDVPELGEDPEPAACGATVCRNYVGLRSQAYYGLDDAAAAKFTDFGLVPFKHHGTSIRACSGSGISVTELRAVGPNRRE